MSLSEIITSTSTFIWDNRPIIISIFIGGLITWFCSWLYYKKAGDEFKKVSMVLLYKAEHPEAKIDLIRDRKGNPVSMVVEAEVHAEGKSTVKGAS